MFKVSTFCLAILALITFNAEAQRAIGRGQSPLTGRGGGSPLGPSNNGGGSITTTNSPSAGYVLTTDGTIYYWGVNTALLTNLPSYALTNFHSVDVVFNAGLAINGASTNNQIAYFNDDISQPYANTAEFGGVYARQFLVASNVTLTGRVTNNTTSGGGFWTADSVGFISISSPNDYILMSHPQGGIVSTLDEWTFGLSGVNIATWSTNNSTIRSNFLVGALLSARNIKLTGGQTASSLLRLDSSTNLATVTIGANLSFDGTTLSATGGGGGGGTNFPNVNLLLGNTNLVLSAGVRKAFHNQTNGSHGINLNLAVPESGYEVTYSVNNSSASDITVTFYTNSVAANPYDIASKTNVNTFTASAKAITQIDLKYIGSGIWVIENVIGPTTILEFGSGITAVTNGVNGRTISISASGGTTAGPDGSQLISMDGETQWINGEDLFVQESFYSGQSNPWGQTRTTSGGSATFTGNPGYVRLSSWPTNTANYAAFHYGSGAGATVPWQSNLFIEAKLQILNSGDITNSEFSVGFYNAMQTLSTTATVRWIGRGDWNPNWIAAVGVGSTYSYATTGLAIAHSTPYTLKIKGTTNSLAFYTNGVLFTTMTSNLPGGVAIQPGARSMATVNTGTVDDNSLDVDWLNIKVR